MAKPRPALAEQLRQEIRRVGLSLNELERRTGVSHAVLSRFLSGKRTLTLPVAGKLAEALGLELCEVEPSGRRPARPR